MKTVIYKGEPVHLGRWGNVTEGDHLQLTEAEFATVADDPRFTCISRRKPKTGVLPVGTEPFDLRTIDWSADNLVTTLIGLGKHTLLRVVAGMDIAGHAVILTEHMDTPIIADVIAGDARDLGWATLTADERKALGTIVEPDPAAAPNNANGEGQPGQDEVAPTRGALADAGDKAAVKALKKAAKALDIDPDAHPTWVEVEAAIAAALSEGTEEQPEGESEPAEE